MEGVSGFVLTHTMCVSEACYLKDFFFVVLFVLLHLYLFDLMVILFALTATDNYIGVVFIKRHVVRFLNFGALNKIEGQCLLILSD